MKPVKTTCLCARLTQVYIQFAQLLPSAHVTDYYLLHPASLQTEQREASFQSYSFSHFQDQQMSCFNMLT